MGESGAGAVGFVGLGVMGRPMVENLLAADVEVVAYSRSSAPIDAVVASGARRATTVRDVADCSRIITMLPDGATTTSIVLGDGGILESASPGTLIIDMGTSGPAVARSIDARCVAAGLRALDAPVSGGEEGARSGALSIMVGGAEADVADARDLLDVLGSTVVHVGPPGAGQVTKAANQMLVGGIIVALAEALLLVERNGIDLAKARRVLASGLAGNRVLELRGERMAAGQFEPGARAALHRKDLGFALDEARALGLCTPLTALVEQLYGALVATDRGHLDHTAILALLESLSPDATPPEAKGDGND